MASLFKSVAAICSVAFGLAACGDQEILLEGERQDIRGEESAALSRAAVPVPISLGAPVANANWTHSMATPSHKIAHPVLDRRLTRQWTTTIGEGNGRKHRLTADPVVSGGRIYTLDSRATVMAHIAENGRTLWSRDLTPSSDRADDASGGGLAVSGDTLFVTSGFGMLTAMEAATGETRWVQKLDAAATGAPTVADGRVYVVARDNLAWALDAENGRILWQKLGVPAISSLTGGAAPAVDGPLVMMPFSSGQIMAVIANTGATAWVASVPGRRLGRAFSRISDLAGDPVADGRRVYAGNHSGRVAAFEGATGQIAWVAEEGAIGPLWVTGGSVFFVSDEAQLLRLDAETGDIIWAQDLPFFTKNRISRRKGTFAHFGPIIAGGRLLVVSDDGFMRAFDPASGSLIEQIELPGDAASNPVVAGGVLYLLTDKGELHAFR
ncbi:MAG: PQQ-binding-like beta-propeller repeat protein [Boseongicola sp.]|nr:MAG: PQQ-binding-like beta-propeller repeat protein [Boseongicola sp.]